MFAKKEKHYVLVGTIIIGGADINPFIEYHIKPSTNIIYEFDSYATAEKWVKSNMDKTRCVYRIVKELDMYVPRTVYDKKTLDKQ